MATFKQCGAHSKRTGEQCKARAVNGSDVCYHHGGKTPQGVDSPHFKTGRYTKHLSQEIREKLIEADDNPMDLLPELDIQRALFADYLSRFEGIRLTAGDITILMEWSSSIGKQVERIAKQRNEDALTGAELAFLAARIADVVSKHIDDPAKQQAFIADIFRELPAGNRVALTEGNR